MSARFLMLGLLCLWFAGLLVACGGQDSTTEAQATAFPPDSPPALGEAVFRTHCAACHAVKGDRTIVGPSLEGIASRAASRVEGQTAEDYLYESILDPNKFLVEGYNPGAMQQNFASVLTSEEITHVLAYLLTLQAP
jgi:cytochrome c2